MELIALSKEQVRWSAAGLEFAVPKAWLYAASIEPGQSIYVDANVLKKTISFNVNPNTWSKAVKIRLSGATPVVTIPKKIAAAVGVEHCTAVSISMTEDLELIVKKSRG